MILKYRSKSSGRKVSDIILEMIKPLLEGANSFKEEQNIVGLGVTAWNLGVIKKNKGEKEMQKTLKDFSKKLPKDIIDTLLDYCDIKCENYSENNELIVDYEFTEINSNQNNLAVSYEMINI